MLFRKYRSASRPEMMKQLPRIQKTMTNRIVTTDTENEFDSSTREATHIVVANSSSTISLRRVDSLFDPYMPHKKKAACQVSTIKPNSTKFPNLMRMERKCVSDNPWCT